MRNRWSWQERRKVTTTIKPVLCGNGKAQHNRKVRTWKKRSERRRSA